MRMCSNATAADGFNTGAYEGRSTSTALIDGCFRRCVGQAEGPVVGVRVGVSKYEIPRCRYGTYKPASRGGTGQKSRRKMLLRHSFVPGDLAVLNGEIDHGGRLQYGGLNTRQ